MIEATRHNNRLFHGWYVALAGGLTAFVAWGVGFYQLGLLLNAFHAEFGWSLSTLSTSAASYCLIVGTASLLMGPAMDRYGPFPVLAAGAVMLSAGMLGAGQARHLWHVYPVIGMLAIGFACSSTLVLGAVVSRWFVRRRAFVMTLTLIGAPLGALLLVPFSAWLLRDYGITTASLVLATIPLVIILPLAFTLIRDEPATKGLLPDGGEHPEPGNAGADTHQSWTLRAGLRTPAWWLITLSFTCIMFGQVSFLVHQVNIFRPAVGLGNAALLVSLTGACGIASRLLGWLGDRSPRHQLLAGFCGIQSIAFLLTGWTTHVFLLALASAIVGLAMGNVVALQPLLMADHFGLRSYGLLFGPASFLTQCGSAAGIVLVGYLAGITGEYALSLTVCAALALVAAGLAVISNRSSDSIAEPVLRR